MALLTRESLSSQNPKELQLEKRRYREVYKGHGQMWWPFDYYGDPPTYAYDHVFQVKEHLQYSEGHRWKSLGRAPDNIGGPFLLTKHIYRGNAPEVLLRQGEVPPIPGHGDTRVYRGPLFCRDANVDGTSFPVVLPTPQAELMALGTTAIANVLPTNPLSGLAVFIGELREGIPSLCGADFFKGRTSRARSAGKEYLNFDFGWRPLVSDVRKFSHSVTNSDEIIAQYEKQSGERIKRRFNFPMINTTNVSTFKSSDGYDTRPVPAWDVTMFRSDDNGVLTVITTEKRRVWFSGCFTYYLPPYISGGDNSKRYAMLANRLYGTRLTPEVLWDLAPWSWAADWFGNTGDVLRNVSAFQNDGLVMPYGYIMEEKSVTVHYESQGNWCITEPFTNLSLFQEFTTVVKSRWPASPYGFGISADSLTARQNATVLALGISRGHGAH